MGVNTMRSWTPAVRLNIKRIPAPSRGESCIVKTWPSPLVEVPGTGGRLLYGEPQWGGTVRRFWRPVFLEKTDTPETSDCLEACGTMVLEVELLVQNRYTRPPLIAMVWGRNTILRNSQGSYSCILLDWTRTVYLAKQDGNDIAAGLGRPKENQDGRRIDYEVVMSWLTLVCLSKPNKMDEAVVGVAAVGRPAMLREWWGNYTCELVSDEFMGQPLLDLTLSIEVNLSCWQFRPLEDLLYKDIHELEGSTVLLSRLQTLQALQLMPTEDMLHKVVHELEGNSQIHEMGLYMEE